MTRIGRKPQGPALIDPLHGSSHAKQRMRLFLRTLAGACTVAKACAELGICESRFYTQRADWLQTALEILEPGSPGRHPKPPESIDAEELRALQTRVRELEARAAAVEVQATIASTMPHLLQRAAQKKTNPPPSPRM